MLIRYLMIYTSSTTRSRTASSLLLLRLILLVVQRWRRMTLQRRKRMQRMDVSKQAMLEEPPEVAVAHVWRDAHYIGECGCYQRVCNIRGRKA